MRYTVKNMRGIAFIGGESPDADVCRKAASGADIIVAADSGLITAEQAGVKPDWIVGDMDSLDSASRSVSRLAGYNPDRIIRYSADKDCTDTELALALLWDKGCVHTALVGGGGGRIDHLLAIRALFEREPSPDLWITDKEILYRIRSPQTLELRLKPKSLVSVFPCAETRGRAKSQGLQWALDGLEWKKGFFGISNVAVSGQCAVFAEAGAFLVIVSITDTAKPAKIML
ncbi:MAG: thiamine diphosphokinase [Treponema sp.]|jgi:thiamine pyrophosphokinase|nr:thiamine diphosphokinase [Treponema sp.]